MTWTYGSLATAESTIRCAPQENASTASSLARLGRLSIREPVSVPRNSFAMSRRDPFRGPVSYRTLGMHIEPSVAFTRKDQAVLEAKEKARVLCVDDEPHVLDGLVRNLRRGYDVAKATSGEEGLKVLSDDGPFAVVLSDMRMPGMDGATFLRKVRQAAPDTTRMLLTGYAQFEAAIAAVNEGGIFRFLTKPCPADNLRQAFEAAVEQHRLVIAERVLLEQTLQGSIQVLCDVLSISNPVAFGRAMRVRKRATDVAAALALKDRWILETGAMLSQLGAISLPDETAERYCFGRDMDDQEKAMVAEIPAISEKLLAKIPRLEPVVRSLAALADPTVRGLDGDSRCRVEILRALYALDDLEVRGISTPQALEQLRGSRRYV